MQGALDRLDGDAIVVGHSYGGQVISQATAGRPDMSHLVDVCAFMCDVGQSPADVNERLPPTWIEIAGDGLAARVTTARGTFFHDVDPQLAAQSQERLQFQSLKAASTPLSRGQPRGASSAGDLERRM